MILDFIRDLGLGAWAWIVGGLLLLGIEVLAPGNIFVWFGLAAVFTGVVSILADLSWQVGLLVFAVSSVVFVIVGRRFFARSTESDEPLLNRRMDRFVGRVFTLSEPIVGGVGTIRVNDAKWRITGPDLPSGTRIRVTGHDGAVLTVDQEDAASGG
ncbi:NfeD family protein [Bauldia sp.]|uniref:NfeD family protein n=1 Tax=Bauldia sp. TaxID=2575872 RepID=UPI003BACD966